MSSIGSAMQSHVRCGIRSQSRSRSCGSGHLRVPVGQRQVFRAERCHGTKRSTATHSGSQQDSVKKTSATQETESASYNAGLWGLAVASPFLVDVSASLAQDGQFGLLEGRIVSLVHPTIMLALFGVTFYALYTGWQHRRSRTLGEDIRELKKQLPAKKTPAKHKEGETEEQGEPAMVTELQNKISGLEKERKDVMAGGFRDKHWTMGSILLAFGVTEGVGGAVNTYLRSGKLFPGPHLFAGAGIVVCWALAASLVPAMQKGNELARLSHISLNVFTLLLFAWQIPTGFEIVQKVVANTPFP